MKKNNLKFWFFLAPALLCFLVVVIIPIIVGFFYSLTDWNGLNVNCDFVGLKNFIDIFTRDSGFLNSLKFTIGVSFFSVILTNAIGLVLAILVTKKFKGSKFLKSIFFMPNLIGGLLLGFAWKFIFTEIFSSISKLTGLTFLNEWLGTTETGFFGLIIVNVWQLSGYMMIVYVAQLQQIPYSAKESAKIDGAGKVQTFLKITFPLLMPAFTIGVFLSIANSFKMFDQNISLTNGVPYHSTQMLALNIYNTAFTNNEFGLAQAKSIIFLIIIASIGLTQLLITKKKEVEM